MKIEMKINRYIKHIGENDCILDNGACIQVTTQNGSWSGWGYAPLIMSKKMFEALKKADLIYLDKDKTIKANNGCNGKIVLYYYKFDIKRMVEFGYRVITE